MFKRLCFILAVIAAIQATSLRKKHKETRGKRQSSSYYYYNQPTYYSYGWNTPVDVQFILDSSGTVGQDNYNYMIQYVQNLIRHWQIGPQGTQVGVMTYGNGYHNGFYLNQYQTEAQLSNALRNLQYTGGSPDLGQALQFAYSNAMTSQHGARANTPHVIIHIGNGISSNSSFTLAQAQKARDKGISVYNIGIGNGINLNELTGVATNPSSKYVYHAENYHSLDTLVNPVASRIAGALPMATNQLPQSSGCLQKADLVFMVDSSSSVDNTEYQQLQNFLKGMVAKLPIGKNNVQVSVMQYSSYPSMPISLNTYSDKLNLLKGIDTMSRMTGGTNTADALKYMRETAFSQATGARKDVPRIGILITDSHSANPSGTKLEADNSRKSNIGLIGVGVGPNADLTELNNVVDQPHSSNTFSVPSFSQLQSKITNIINAACHINRKLTSGTGVTHGPDPCQDKLSNCNRYPATACNDFDQWARENCARTCHKCNPLYTDPPPVCKDKITNCATYQADVCSTFSVWAHENCRQFCGYCGAFKSSSGFYGKCFYKGKTYKQGETWQDGCQYQCTCQNAGTGSYKCFNQCPVYHDLPSQCTLVPSPGKCCLQPVCNFQQKITTSTGSGKGTNSIGISVCVYNGKQYYQGQAWEDGCDYKCSCINANQGVYSCQSYCPTYSNLPSECRLVKKPGQCCQTPLCDFSQQTGSFVGTGSVSGIGSSTHPKQPQKCEDKLPNCLQYADDACGGVYLKWAKDNCRKRCNLCSDGKANIGPNDRCYYQGKTFKQGQKWQPTCDVTCICEQAAYGYYRCTNTCPTYTNLPNGCKATKKAGDCCETVDCSRGTFLSSTGNLNTLGNGGGIKVIGPGGHPINVVPTPLSGVTPAPGTGGTGMQPPKINGCLFNGQIYIQGQQWNDGCSQTCTCTDAVTGMYQCRQRCPTYQGFPAVCSQISDPNDHCCKIPTCKPLPGQVPIPTFGNTHKNIGAVKPPSVTDLYRGYNLTYVITFPSGHVGKPTAPSVTHGGGIGYCEYKGHRYTQSQSWEDGCDFSCVCEDASVGKWACNERCPKYHNIPKPYCRLETDPSNPCCKKPICVFNPDITFFIVTASTVTTPRVTQRFTYPSVTTPRPAYCVYKNQHYTQGQVWYDGCSSKCSCNNAQAGIYRCLTRCPSYQNVPAGCKQVPDPKDPVCCTVPQCNFGSVTNSVTGLGVIPTLKPVVINQYPTGKPSGVGYCEYNGHRYKQGDKWQDGCHYDCVCQDADSGQYKCTERCPRYPPLPAQCKMIIDFANPCCKKPTCDFTGGSGSVTGLGHLTPPPGYYTPSPGYTGNPIPAYCIYNGGKFFQGQTWTDGCSKTCRCEDSVKNIYTCNDRCSTYGSLPPQCSLVTDPKDGCCKVPNCQFIPVTGQISGTLAPGMIPTAVPGQITGQVPTPKPGPGGQTPAPLNFCIYKGVTYNQGQSWEDGCKYHCTCEDVKIGKYICKEKCPVYNNLPPQCQLSKDPANPCCMVPNCDFTGVIHPVTGQGHITPSPGPFGSPTPNSVTHSPPLPKAVCVYRGQRYTQGQQWFDGCSYKCICENADQGVYRCNSRCSTFNGLPSQCTLGPDPKDPFCCKVPHCNFSPKPGQVTGMPPTIKPGTFTGGVVIPTPGPYATPGTGVSPSPGYTPLPQPVPKGVCVYKGKQYQKGQHWQDGCDYNCECLDDGKYKCTEQCPRYGNLPSQCKMVTDPYNPCCKKPSCNFNPSTGGVSGTGVPVTSAPKKMCIYHRVKYNQGQTWTDGCQLKCVCENAVVGVYRCNERCARYDNLAAGCQLTTDPNDACCRVPYCRPLPQPTPGPGVTPGIPGTPAPYVIPTLPPGKITGQTVNKPDKNHPTNTTLCVYQGVVYHPGETWKDGCNYNCRCADNTGKYTCTQRCPVYTNIPPFCIMGVDPNDHCCRKPSCNPLTGLTPAPQNTPSPAPGTTVAPGVRTPAPTPSPNNVCVYHGTTYVQGQKWFVGCDKVCVCENGMTGYYRCSDRCKKFDNVPSQCRMIADPKDPQCCQVPDCTPTPGPGGYPTPPPGVSPTPNIVTNVPGYITGIAPIPTPGPGGKTPTPKHVCTYNGREYRQSERWQDGCKYNCICEDGMTGKYKCQERCAQYPFVPPQCKLQRDSTDFCCYKMVCDQTKPTINPNTPSPGPGQTPLQGSTPAPNPSVCVYKGVVYRQGQQWNEGCSQKCQCDDASQNFYSCYDRCPTYNPPPGSQCTETVDPNDACCRIPHCVIAPTPGPHVGPSLGPNATPRPNPYPQPTIIPKGTIGGQKPDKNPLTNQGFCRYKGGTYRQGDKWQDGCDLSCECVDDHTGRVTCTQRCVRISAIPAFCTLVQDPYDHCCKKASCPTLPPRTVTTGAPNPFSSNSPTPNPNITPVPPVTQRPVPRNVCVYKGKTYTTGQQFFDGCTKKCICENGMTGYYTCSDRCATYGNIQSNCIMVPDPVDPVCCQAPKCDTGKTITGVQGNITGYGKPTPAPQLTPSPGTGLTPSPRPGQSTIAPPKPPQGCVYKSKLYQPGQRWLDGCDYSCVCEDGMTGKYTCTERCSKFPNLPPNCHMVPDFNKPCCKKPECDTTPPVTPPVGQTLSPSLTPTLSPTVDFCVYNGVPLRKGQSVKVGCDKVCRCEDPMSGKVNCDDRCPTYPPLKQGCTLMTNPDDPCCQMPHCTTANTNGPEHILKGSHGTITGHSLPPTNPNPLVKTTGCLYHGVSYHQGQTWEDGCTYTCECLDDHSGKYKCTEKCVHYPSVPSGCSMVPDLNNKCCQVAYCPNLTPTDIVRVPTKYPIGYTPFPGATPYLGPTPYPIGYTPSPGATPYPGPSRWPIGQTPSPGATRYLGPTPWPIGYKPYPGATPYPGPSKYPIGQTPWPGATVYLGPTPYPIGFTPSPGATPYPGPSRYPIGYTPSPGATPYLGPTPYPIGYTPYPGATPYPGPSKYPIGYTPSPGATPYLGPTPYPIGYTPYPGATPYPGPTKYPIGFTPSPGATPYLGPTPWPLGYTPYPGATPYPGPTRYPIGYTPSPGATPYLGPTPWPIGFTPSPGATPYPGPTPYPIGYTPWPGATPYPGPTIYPIGYTPSPGATPYLGPTPWPIGYTPWPYATPYPGPTRYPIGYTPSPGATPYLGPTPYPIGYTPWPGATPYPGPTRYPIGFTPSPGATPYLGPTPWPIGYTPSPGATPYPGPSRYPIGFIPSPGATPYLGPTPYPIGYTPYPGATPYPGPTKYPIGYTPSPGATPYAGPTPWPIGYTPSPGATPYLGRTPWPIGFTPSPGATPYPGPTKYPIGYTPFPGATPYLGPTPWPIGFTPYPSATPYPGPTRYPLFFTPSPGATPYVGPTPWPIGYTPWPSATPYPGPNKYPIGYTPSPGATPYLGPTPYPIGFTPWVGATPYPGPSKYPIGYTPYPGATRYIGPTPWPIGYTPSPGATPYLGPTPVPIGYTPYPGATPYPGPSRYPIGYTPSPGATPYLGPTPYPIGYTPFPGATPYPGPSKYPIGFIPSPGATPYLGPTPWPIGFTPYPGATPYPGPSKYPIGYTPYPWATPYLGPTPYPLGYTPYPGATPYPGPSKYPIGFIPSPGATPYVGPTPWPVGYTAVPGGTPYVAPTPWPIGFTPWIGATPYPGPNKYPIGYTPYLGATRYLGPTPWPIGYTPSPGATPYPGPSKYPIGYTPYPGATPYPGPTPWPIGYTPYIGATPYPGRTINPYPTPYPIGYTPYKGATPYPGPSIYPIGYTPYFGATRYLGPTPWPIGYTPYPGATPYPGPSKYPIGFTPFPGGTPYLGPTPYPIGYTPWPGATPYPGPTLPPGFTLAPTPVPTLHPRPQGQCAYKNQYYREQQVWYDGCDKICRCENGNTGDVRCQQRCASYPPAGPNCYLIPDPKDPTCCELPNCPLVQPGATPTPGFIQVSVNPGFVTGVGKVNPPLVPTIYGVYTPAPFFNTPTPNPFFTPAPKKGCMYKGVIHHQGDKWQDGCDYNCECLNENTGQYKCSEICTRVPNPPPQCVMLQDPTNRCCMKPYCDFVNPTPFPHGIPTPLLNFTPVPGATTGVKPNINKNTKTGFCVYKGSSYRQGVTWQDGCEKKCVCDDAMTQRYSCTDRCKSYGSVPAGCIMMTDPKDRCCLVPDCTKVPVRPITINPVSGVHIVGTRPPGVTPWYGPGTKGYVVPIGIPGTFTGVSGTGPNGVNPSFGNQITGYGGACVYKNKPYKQNEKWSDGCDYTCECVDATRGQYRCSDRCPRPMFLPPQCVQVKDPKDACCNQVRCDPKVFVTPSPGTFVTPPTISFTPSRIVFTNSNKPPIPVSHTTSSTTTPASTTTTKPIKPPNMCQTPDGRLHPGGQSWSNGCKETCRCADPQSNDIKCTQRCRAFMPMPSFCHMVADPNDACCQVPSCNYKGTQLVPVIGTTGPTVSPTMNPSVQNVIPIGTHNVFTGTGRPLGTTYTSSMGGRNMCVYRNTYHKPGETWNDGCQYTCTCMRNANGKYRCIQKCPTYPPLPSYCQYVPVVGQCCPSLHCNIPNAGHYHPTPQINPHVAPGLLTPTLGPTQSPQLILVPGTGSVFTGSSLPGHGTLVPSNPLVVAGINDKCIYQGKMYNQGETWDDGCKFTCRCIESRSGYYQCKPKCPSYGSLPQGCYTVKAVGQCCDTPICRKPDGSTVRPLQNQNFYPVYGTYSGGVSGFRPGYTPGMGKVIGGRTNGCVFKGVLYRQGQTWSDGCNYDCTCMDVSTGQYSCAPKCSVYTKLPPVCHEVKAVGDCCAKVSCDPITASTITSTTSTPSVGPVGPCVDKLNNCNLYRDDSCKGKYLDWAKKNCPVRCGLCPSTTPSPLCVDKLSNCVNYGKQSCTGQFLMWAKNNCRKYCGLCTNTPVHTLPSTTVTTTTTALPQTGCKDKIPNCASYGTICTGTYEHWAHENCQKYCGFCPANCKDALTNCASYGANVCTQFAQWAKTNCAKTCNICPTSVTPSPSPYVVQPGWTILMKGVAGVSGDLFQLWQSPNTANQYVPAAMSLTSAYKGHYKPDLSNHWSSCNFNKVKVGIFNNGVEKASVVFNAQGSTKMSWFDPQRIISSTWTDMRNAPKDIFSMMGNPNTGREFYMTSGQGSSCATTGWMMVSTRGSCTYEAGTQHPAFYYVPGTTAANFGQTQLQHGDVFAILGQGDCTKGQVTSPTGVTHYSNGCLYKRKFYREHENWLDGCSKNCTCLDGRSGQYQCRDLCPTYPSLPSGCQFVKSPGQCCPKLNCDRGCLYNGVVHPAGSTWKDGCTYRCKCLNGDQGRYECKGICYQFSNLPSECHMQAPAPGKCCQTPVCPSNVIINYPPGYVPQ